MDLLPFKFLLFLRRQLAEKNLCVIFGDTALFLRRLMAD
jgi:hypothetical protein